jgi:transcriptional regulator with XRE-family HTH domain
MIGERMKELRKKLDLTLEALAAKCGVSTNTVWRWEQDKQVPTISLLQKLAETLQTTENFLTGKTSDPSSAPLMVIEDFASTPRRVNLRQEEVTTNYKIIVPVYDLPPYIEDLDKNLSDYTAYNLTVPLVWIGKLPVKSFPFFFKMKGNAMAGAGLHVGFLELVNPDEPLSNGDIHLLVVRTKKKNVYEIVVRWTYIVSTAQL